jgi:hypothetical protein
MNVTWGTRTPMGLLAVLLVPFALGVVTVLLLVTAWLEDSFLSPRSLILYTVNSRSRRVSAEDVERMVVLQSERLLRDVRH